MARIGVVGGGSMGGAIVRGSIAGGVDAGRWIVADRGEQTRRAFEGMGVEAVGDAGALMEKLTDGDAVVVAVKPQQLAAVAEQTRGSGFGGVVISVLAGTTSGAVREAFGGRARVVRSMPNTPAKVGLGLTAIAPGAGATDADMGLAEELFAGVGRVVRIEEDQMNALTAVAGSGPAYVFYLAEAMERAAVEMGLPAGEVKGIVAQTIKGSAALLDEEGADARELRRAVTSPKGTTEAATTSMDEKGVMEALVASIQRARDRGEELAKG